MLPCTVSAKNIYRGIKKNTEGGVSHPVPERKKGPKTDTKIASKVAVYKMIKEYIPVLGRKNKKW